LGRTLKPAASDRFTISSVHAPVRQTTSAIFCPAYPPSAKMRLMNGNSRRARRSRWKAPSGAVYDFRLCGLYRCISCIWPGE
jgi:hypothetical protein